MSDVLLQACVLRHAVSDNRWALIHQSATQVIGLLQKQCAIFGVDVKNAQAIVKVLTDSGLTTEETQLLIEMCPQILRRR